MHWLSQLDEMKTSALKEMVNVGISHVATAVGEMSNEKVSISVPLLSGFSSQSLPGTGNGFRVGAYFQVDGLADFSEALILFSQKDAEILMERFIQGDGSIPWDAASLSLADKLSVFHEVSTIMSHTFFSAVSLMFGLPASYALPVSNFEGEELEGFIARTLRQSEGIAIEVRFSGQQSQFSGSFLLMPEVKSIGKFFKAIGLE